MPHLDEERAAIAGETADPANFVAELGRRFALVRALEDPADHWRSPIDPIPRAHRAPPTRKTPGDPGGRAPGGHSVEKRLSDRIHVGGWQPAPTARPQLELRGITGTPAESQDNPDQPASGPTSEPLPEPGGWTYAAAEPMGRVERRTWGHRRDLARAHDETAREARRASRRYERAQDRDRAAGAERREKWHRDRARGQRDRFVNGNRCGQGVGVITCHGCGSEHGAPVGCGVVRLCVRCRDVRAQHRRAVLWRARDAALRACRGLGRLRRRRHGGAWHEQHCVLTGPDPRMGNPERRIETMCAAWRTFSRCLQAYQRGADLGLADGRTSSARRTARGFAGAGGAYYSRCFEWTPGADGAGHPHFHVWILGPRLPRDLVRAWWAAALAQEGVDVRDTDPLVHLERARVEQVIHEVHKGGETVKSVRIRATDPRGHVLGYVEGWCVSEMEDKHGRIVQASPDVLARVYVALEGRRHAQTSRGLMRLGFRAVRCACCHQTDTLVCRIVSWRSPTLLEEVERWRTWREVRAGPGLARAGPGAQLGVERFARAD